MIKVFTDYMLGPIGRAIEAAYFDHALQASLLVLVWMMVVIVGLNGVARMRRLLRIWVEEVLPQYDPDHIQTPEHILLALEPRWEDAASQVRFMPTKRGLWTQRATPDGLRAPAGFTPEGIDQLITRITGRKRETMMIAADAVVRPTRSRKRVYH